MTDLNITIQDSISIPHSLSVDNWMMYLSPKLETRSRFLYFVLLSHMGKDNIAFAGDNYLKGILDCNQDELDKCKQDLVDSGKAIKIIQYCKQKLTPLENEYFQLAFFKDDND